MLELVSIFVLGIAAINAINAILLRDDLKSIRSILLAIFLLLSFLLIQ
jgi:hypothetical protein